ncbi:MAG: hypothetical protein ACO1SX_01665 [Actinomycetota bacterium]
MLWLVFVQKILQVLQKHGSDIQSSDFSRDALGAKFTSVKASVVARLEADGATPARFSDSEDEKRDLIRSAEYLLWKATIISITGRKEGSNFAADKIRDRHDDKVVAVVQPLVNSELSTDALVQAVIDAELELTT